jgi:hypothetical protein
MLDFDYLGNDVGIVQCLCERSAVLGLFDLVLLWTAL